MSWQAGAFTILALALAAGFAWYERTRPDARIVALVATLAAFAALGRVAFAALPNVKPTTDIVLISGYALGGAPGFMVGALAGLSSNFFFGQGPWTPWQMAAWGATGLLGAGLAGLSGRRAGRWLLAVVCGVVGFAFTAFQDVGDWITYSDHSLAQLGVYVGKGIGFDFVHAAGCVAFALAFGPALARSIGRFTLRIDVKWLPPVVPVLLAVAALSALQPTDRANAANTPTGYLLSAQNSDGGFGASPGAASSQLYAGWSALGLAAAGHNPRDVRHGGQSLAAYITAGERSARDPGSIERTILALRAAGLPAGSLVGQLAAKVRPSGSVAKQVNLTAFAVLAFRAAGVAPPARMTAWLGHQEDADGGFNFAIRGGASDIDDTAAVLEALGGASPDRAVHFIEAHENHDGGFPSQPRSSSNAQSTSWAVQGLLASGVPLSSLGRPLGYLRSLIAPDGHVRYARGSDETPVWVTAEALMALDAKPLPIIPLTVRHSAPGARSHAHAGARRHAAGKRRRARARGKAHRVPAPPLGAFASALGVVEALVLAPLSA